MKRVLVCRTAWMDFYDGRRSDKARGGGAFVKEEGFGGEIFNFKADRDKRFRGYFRPPGSGRLVDQRINIDRLGAEHDDESVGRVTVFWAATHPALGGTRVVGWYDEAIVHRWWRPSPRKRTLPNGNDAGFMVEGAAAKLLAPDDRVFVLPRATERTAGIGQSNVWYPDSAWSAKLLAYKSRASAGRLRPTGGVRLGIARTTDTEARLRVERAAMRATIQWCVDRGLRYKDVSARKLGWDVEAGEGKGVLRIEVKGTSGALGDALLELTPNEFTKMKEHRDSFRLAAVSVQQQKHSLVMFAWSRDAGAWIADGGRYTLHLHEVLGARLEVRRTT